MTDPTLLVQEIVEECSHPRKEEEEDRLDRLLWALSQIDAAEELDEEGIYQILNPKEHDAPLIEENERTSRLEVVWHQGLVCLANLMDQSSPFDVHASATQAILMNEDNPVFVTTCLLCAIQTLQRCETPVRRPKRWRSLLLETLRWVQRYNNEDTVDRPLTFQCARDSVSRVGPLVAKELADDRLLYVLATGIVAIAAKRLFHHNDDLAVTASSWKACELLLGDVSMADFVWMHPWRSYYHTKSPSTISTAATLQGLLSYLTLQDEQLEEERHEELSCLDTTWDSVGVALWTVASLEFAPVVYAPTYQAHLWLPHCLTLINAASVGTRQTGMQLLQHTLISLAPQSLSLTPSGTPDSGVDLLQLLGNQMVQAAAVQTKTDTTLSTAALTHRVMQLAVSKYPPGDQVALVRQLLERCPHAGLEPKLLDLWRPFGTWKNDTLAQDQVWEYLNNSVFGEIEVKDDRLVDVESVLGRCEFYSAAVGLVEVWICVTRKPPPGVESRIHIWHKAIQDLVQSWASLDPTALPAEYHRLYLLHHSLSVLLERMI